MKASELRLGNYIKQPNGINTVFHLSEGEFVNTFAEEEIEPIPLTEEWLLRFNKVNWLSKDVYGYFVRFNGNKIYIKFVHSLQNMYFCIEQKELL